MNGFIFVGFDYGDKLLFSDKCKKRLSFACLKTVWRFIFVGFDSGDKNLVGQVQKSAKFCLSKKQFGVSILEYQSLFSLFLWKNNSDLWQNGQRKVETPIFQFGGHVDGKSGI